MWHLTNLNFGIFGPTPRLSSSRKLATLHHYWNRGRRSQPFGWLYTSTTQHLTHSWALKTIDLSPTTSRRQHPCRILIKKVDTPQREPPTCSRTESTLSLYPLYVTLREGDLFLVYIPVSSLWHGRLGHLSKVGITHLSRVGYIPNSPSRIISSTSIISMANG